MIIKFYKKLIIAQKFNLFINNNLKQNNLILN